MGGHDIFEKAIDERDMLKIELKRLRRIEKAVKKFLRRSDEMLFSSQIEEAIEQLCKSVEEAKE